MEYCQTVIDEYQRQAGKGSGLMMQLDFNARGRVATWIKWCSAEYPWLDLDSVAPVGGP